MCETVKQHKNAISYRNETKVSPWDEYSVTTRFEVIRNGSHLHFVSLTVTFQNHTIIYVILKK